MILSALNGTVNIVQATILHHIGWLILYQVKQRPVISEQRTPNVRRGESIGST